MLAKGDDIIMATLERAMKGEAARGFVNEAMETRTTEIWHGQRHMQTRNDTKPAITSPLSQAHHQKPIIKSTTSAKSIGNSFR